MADPRKSKEIQGNPIFEQLSDSQWRYITARLENPKFNKKQAAEHIGLTSNTIYAWPDYVEEALTVARANIQSAAVAMIEQKLLKAIAVKVSHLDSDDERISAGAATEIIDRLLGKATQHLDVQAGVTVKGYAKFSPDDWDDDA